MNIHTPNTPGGSDAASHMELNTNLLDDLEVDYQGGQLMGVQDFDDDDLPEWVKILPDMSTVKYDDDGFFYLTPDDFSNGGSYNPTYQNEACSSRRDYDLGPYGKLRVVIIDGKAWCSLDDAGKAAGIPSVWLTGSLDWFEINVRGVPGELDPDGIRYLRYQGLSDVGIRLEALVRHVNEHRREDPRVSDMLGNAIADVYKESDLPESPDILCINLWSTFDLPIKGGQICQRLFHDPLEGEFAISQTGSHLWFKIDDIADCAHLDSAIISQIAGDKRILRIPDSMIHPVFDTGGEKTYVRADVVEKLYAAMPREPHTRAPLPIRIVKHHRTLLRSGDDGLKVSATALKGMLAPHLDLELWRCWIDQRYCEFLSDKSAVLPFDHNGDHAIPLHLACEIAATEGTFTGKLTALLLTEGGFLHGGAIDETATETLLRFQGLVPDRRGRVRIRKVWEFINSPLPFADWYQDRLDCRWPKDQESPDEPTAPIDSAWVTCIWDAFDSDHYCPI